MNTTGLIIWPKTMSGKRKPPSTPCTMMQISFVRAYVSSSRASISVAWLKKNFLAFSRDMPMFTRFSRRVSMVSL